MKPHHVTAVSLAALTVFALALPAQKSPVGKRLTLDARRTLGTPRAFRGLTLIPVYDSEARPGAAYLTLDEGLKAKTASVSEAQGGGQVNTLFLSNTGKTPLYVMAGEVVLGGQQDRMLSRDTIIPPGKTHIPITVFCVEHGRWTGQRQFDASAKMVASADIRKDAQNGAFFEQRQALLAEAPNHAPAAPNVNAPSQSAQPAQSLIVGRQRRDAAQQTAGTPAGSGIGESQQRVWAKVAAKNGRFKAAPVTGTYRGILNMTGGEAQKTVAPYLDAFAGSLDQDRHLVGVVAAVNGKVIASDIFGDPALFRKMWPKLLRSYAADAAENAPAAPSKFSAVTAQSAKAFLLEARNAKIKAVNKSALSATERLESPLATDYVFRDKLEARDAKERAALHENALRK